MAKLITNHDFLHLHAISGLIALCNFILRLYYMLTYKNAFPDFENKFISILLTLNHLCLPLLSLSIHLPEKRNFHQPMIWKEFRLHSLLFSSRHVITTIISLYNFDFNIKVFIIIKLAIILLTVYLAKIISDKYGDKELRTTNAMPYPETLKDNEILKIKREYAKKQFGATLFCAIINNPTYNFIPLYAIQSAPFLMTLVRKGKCNTKYYHIIYSLFLLFPFYFHYILLVNFKCDLRDILFGLIYVSCYTLRISYNINPYILWSLIIPIFILIWEYKKVDIHIFGYIAYIYMNLKQVNNDFIIFYSLCK
jgi:hypothetical protein